MIACTTNGLYPSLPMDMGNSFGGLACQITEGFPISTGIAYTCINECASSQDQRTALHYASESGHHNTVGVLLERGANCKKYDKVSGVSITTESYMCSSIQEKIRKVSSM